MSDRNIDPEVGHADEEACGKLWEVYVQEAQRYDEGLVRSWKEDMDVTLVFSGLYSAVLTAFIVESYQNLQESPADASLIVLKQISSQILASSQAANVTLEPLETFKPTPSALVCNLLWFFSLSLALLCAILATFVQQWARKFLHRTTIVRSPSNQAHLIQFLYFGLRDLRVHAIVDAIPALLHLSIFLFFSGLLAFLIDVNIALVYVIAIFLLVISSLYIFFTIHPIATLRSFFHTPLSPLIWRIWQSDFLRSAPKTTMGIFSLKQKSVSNPEKPGAGEQVAAIHEEPSTPEPQPTKLIRSLQDAMLTACRAPNHTHELHSIMWTMKSINDDVELLPFVEALIDALWGTDGPRTGNYYLIRPLLETNDPHFNIIQRVSSLLKNAQNPWFDTKHRKRCCVVCPKFFWIMAWIFLQSPDTFTLPKLPGMEARSIAWFTSDIIKHLVQLRTSADYDNTLDYDYASSAAALCALSMHQTIRQVDTTSMNATLYYAQLEPLNDRLPSDLALLNRMDRVDPSDLDARLKWTLQGLVVPEFRRCLENALVHIPYQFDRTIDCFWQWDIKYLADSSTLMKLMDQIERCSSREFVKGTPSLRELDRIFQVLCSLSHRHHASAIVQYIAKRVKTGGWTATKDVWKENVVLVPFYNVIDCTGLADWSEDYFVAVYEVFKCTSSSPIRDQGFRELVERGAPIEVSDRDSQFWKTYLFHYQDQFVDGVARADPLATSLQIDVMIYFLYSNNHALLSPYLLSYIHDNAQLRDFTEEYIRKDPKELYSVILILICADLGPKESPVQLRDVLDFYLHCKQCSKLGLNNRLFELPGILKEFSDFTDALADGWVREPSVERLETLLIVWFIWPFLLDRLELSSTHRSEFEILYGAGKKVLRPDSTRMITKIKEQGAKFHESWLERVFSPYPKPDLEELILYVFDSLPEKAEVSIS